MGSSQESQNKKTGASFVSRRWRRIALKRSTDGNIMRYQFDKLLLEASNVYLNLLFVITLTSKHYSHGHSRILLRMSTTSLFTREKKEF